jgi:hypothetical protein
MFTAAPSYCVVHAFLISTLPFSLSVFILYLILEAAAKHAETCRVPVVSNLVGFWKTSLPVRLTAYVSIAVAIMGFAPEEVAPFIYFQF